MTALLIMSFGLVLGSVIPYTHKGFKNDAALLVQLWEDKERWADYYANRESRNASLQGGIDRYAALDLNWLALMKEGLRPREWDASLVEQTAALQDGKVNEAVATHYGFYWAADRGDWEKSGRLYWASACTS